MQMLQVLAGIVYLGRCVAKGQLCSLISQKIRRTTQNGQQMAPKTPTLDGSTPFWYIFGSRLSSIAELRQKIKMAAFSSLKQKIALEQN